MLFTVKKNFIHFSKIFGIIIISILILTNLLYKFTNDDDFANLPPKDKNKLIDDRFYALFYYNCSTHGGLGDAMIYPKSTMAKLYTSFYLLLVAAGIFTALDS